MRILKIIVRLLLGGSTLYFSIITLYKKTFGFQDFDTLINTGFIMGNSILLVFFSYQFSQLYFDFKNERKCVKVLFWFNCIPIAMMNAAFLQRLIKQLSFSSSNNLVLVLAPVLLAFHVYDFIYYQAQNRPDEDLKDVIDF